HISLVVSAIPHAVPLSLLRFSFNASAPHPLLPSFPTRRSSDLLPGTAPFTASTLSSVSTSITTRLRTVTWSCPMWPPMRIPGRRSEEHTSELQSLTNLVCRLLLEKKMQRTHTMHMVV